MPLATRLIPVAGAHPVVRGDLWFLTGHRGVTLTAPDRAPSPEPSDVGIIAALPIEVAQFRLLLTDVHKHHIDNLDILDGRLGGRLVSLVTSGPGRRAARRAAERLLLGHRPRWVISTGFAGGLDPALDRYSLVVPSKISNPEGHLYHARSSVGYPGILADKHLHTVDHIIRTAEEKARIRKQRHADLVDMETFAVAEVCAQKGVLFTSMRVITDTAQEDLPAEIMAILGRTGSYRVGAVAGALWRRPSCVADLWELRTRALEAARRIAEVLAHMIQNPR